MRDNALHGGQQAYIDVKRTLVRGQRGLCAYCEARLADGLDDQALDAKKHEQRVEHYHPKSDKTGALNWALEWSNMWAVCLGGSSRPPQGAPPDPLGFLEPLPANLSCDAFKEHQVDARRLPVDPEGWILSPADVPAFPILFQFAPVGTPEPHSSNCAATTMPGNQHVSTEMLVSETIKHLNLGYVRLNEARRVARAQLEKRIEIARKRSPASGTRPPVVTRSANCSPALLPPLGRSSLP
ncbi:MAG TPA: hypothetical protein VI756_27645 [Blastocatellia bacterium]